jgi:nucleoid DNA-binding protein
LSFNRVKKVNPRIRGTELFTYISANTSLTKPQVRECFKTYAKMIKEISSSKYADKGLTITLPYVGQFFYEKRKGRKGGSTYKIPDGVASTNVITRTIEKDRPDYYILKFKVFGTLSNFVKEVTKINNE